MIDAVHALLKTVTRTFKVSLLAEHQSQFIDRQTESTGAKTGEGGKLQQFPGGTLPTLNLIRLDE